LIDSLGDLLTDLESFTGRAEESADDGSGNWPYNLHNLVCHFNRLSKLFLSIRRSKIHKHVGDADDVGIVGGERVGRERASNDISGLYVAFNVMQLCGQCLGIFRNWISYRHHN